MYPTQQDKGIMGENCQIGSRLRKMALPWHNQIWKCSPVEFHHICFKKFNLIPLRPDHRQTFIDLWRGTHFSLAWLVALGNLNEKGFKKGYVLQNYFSTAFESTFGVYWNGAGAAELSCTDPVICVSLLLRGCCLHVGIVYRIIMCEENTVENRIFAVSSPSNTRQNQFMLL